jgi:hypothetical protein
VLDDVEYYDEVLSALIDLVIRFVVAMFGSRIVLRHIDVFPYCSWQGVGRDPIDWYVVNGRFLIW